MSKIPYPTLGLLATTEEVVAVDVLWQAYLTERKKNIALRAKLKKLRVKSVKPRVT
jgi:hypothetical protein